MQASGSLPSDAVGRMAHILSAEKLWLERLRHQPQSVAVWPNSTIAACQELTDQMSSLWKEYLRQLSPGDYDGTIDYRNSKGEGWSSRVEDVLNHVLLHSAYHRGQIALQMRSSGMEPAYTDFIHAVRQDFVK